MLEKTIRMSTVDVWPFFLPLLLINVHLQSASIIDIPIEIEGKGKTCSQLKLIVGYVITHRRSYSMYNHNH